MEKIKKILIYRPEHIGDYIVSLPAIRSLRENFPKAKITIVIGPWNKKLAEATQYIDEMIIFEDPLVERKIGYKKIFKKSVGIFKKFKYFFNDLDKDYDLLVIFSRRKFTKFIIPFFKAKKKLCGVYFEKQDELERDRCLRVIFPLKIKYFKEVDFFESLEDGLIVSQLLNNYKKKEIKNVVIHPFSPLKEKNWPIENWIKLIKKLSRYHMKFFVIGTFEDKEAIKNFCGDCKIPAINLAGKLNLIQLKKFIGKCDLFIGPSSGPMYLADMSNTPIISLIGPESPPEWNPSKKKDVVLRCNSVSKISVEEVFNEVKNIFKN